MRAHPLSLAVLAALALAGCSQEPLPQKTRPAARIEAPVSPSAPGTHEIDPALKDRLARQEAAARLFERNVLEPPPPRTLETRSPEPPPPSNPPEPPPKFEAPKATPAPARIDLAAAKPSTLAAAPAAAPRLITRVDPDFPREAIQAGVDKGTVKARVTLDETGAVTRVEVVEAYPRRVFDRAVTRALSQWRFNEGAAGRTVDTEVDFNR